MAEIRPTLPHTGHASSGLRAELDVLQSLADGLSDAFVLFHSVEWSRGYGDQEQHGEVDVVVVNQAGDVLLIEVKSGEVEFKDGGIFKRYSTQKKDVTRQIGLQYSALRGRLNDAHLSVALRHLLVLPQMHVETESVLWPRERIVDSTQIASLSSYVAQYLGVGVSQKGVLERVLAFFENRFKVEPDVSALAGRLHTATTRMSAGLATWVPRITVPSGIIRVSGTAGSGKTQLALRLLRDADKAGLKATYICFNRALADHMAKVLPVRIVAETFHELALKVARQTQFQVNLDDGSAFDSLARHCIQSLDSIPSNIDLLVLDEVQDFQIEWVEAMLGRLRPAGRAVLMEDAGQQLYADREPFDIPEAVVVTSRENFRSPRALVRLINGLRLTDSEIEAAGPFEGELPDPIVYPSSEKVASCTISAVERCLHRGFDLRDIAIISMRGRERSVLQGNDTLGPWALRRFTGGFDAGGGAIWTPGDLLIDSVRRFKGQAAEAIVLTECDLAELDTMSRRLLFVGLTRARVHLEWVISPETQRLLERELAF